ncbi:MAG TPA: glycosyltransferase [Thermoanaerobaculia bacterium]|jgi:cellulose synthase/poly-beta-1,6-N-acetylglucosamine synthase-like glycosyltransferase
MSLADAAVLASYYLTLGVLTVYSVHRLHLISLRRRHAPPQRATELTRWPSVTVQLPLYNEPNVAARLIDAVCSIGYPGALDVQVLDDSNDATTCIAAGRVAHWRARGVRIEHIRRETRDGYKAGALAHGLRLSHAELLAVYDADFVPPPDVLTRMVPYFADAHVGMVQARWGHLNRERSILTRVQALFLDAHFAVESAARNFGGRFFNFNGTAGIWRREAIEDAGGWSASTLTEDLDLSYRAQLAGWRFVFLNDVVVPAELPAALSGFQQQQHRWAKGSIQTARKLAGPILGNDVRRAIKTEALFHLTNNSAYLLTLVLALLIVPSIVIRQRLGILWTYGFDLLFFTLSTGSVLWFYVEGQRWAGRPRPKLRELLAVLPVGVGMSVRNAAAVLEGLVQQGGEFKRTPKEGVGGWQLAVGSGTVPPPGESLPLPTANRQLPTLPYGEMALALFFAAAFVMFVAARQWISLPFLGVFLSGYGYVAFQALKERLSSAATVV